MPNKSSFPLVYILVLNWRSSEKAVECVLAIQNSNYPNYKIALIDNGSDDGSEQFIKQRLPQQVVLQTGKNLGYGGGNNVGIRYAIGMGAEFVWIVNPDTRVHHNSLSIMMQQAMLTDPSVGICGPVLANDLQPDNFYIAGYSASLEKGIKMLPNPFNFGEGATSRPRDVSSVVGCSMLIRSRVFFDIGLIREDFFMYLEETEFCFRSKRNGWRVVVCPQAIDAHPSPRNKSARAKFLMERNAILLSRVEKINLWQTIFYTFKLERFLRGELKPVLSALRRKIIPVVAGFKPLKPVPTL